MKPTIEQLLGEPLARRGAFEPRGQPVPIFTAFLDQTPIAGHAAPAIEVAPSEFGMELEAIGGYPEAERMVGTVLRPGEVDRSVRQVEAVLMEGED